MEPAPGVVIAAAALALEPGLAELVEVALSGLRRALDRTPGATVPVELDELAAELRAARSCQSHPRGVDGAQSPVMVNYKTAAKVLGVSERTVHRLVASGALPATRLGRRVLFDAAQLLEVRAS